jgi:outer membrane protein assembly factor BamA
VEGARRLLELGLADAGYPDGRVVAEVDTSQEGRARVVMRAVPGDFVRIGTVVVSGLERTRPQVVRRILRLTGVQAGAPYSAAAFETARRRLFELALFRSVEVAPVPGQERGAERGVVFRCEEGAQRSYLLGLGYDTVNRARVTLGWSHLNLFGGAHAVSVETRLSSREERFQAGWREARLPWLHTPGAAMIYRTEEEYATYSQLRRGLWLEVGNRRRRPLRPWIRYEYQIVRPDAPDDVLSDLEREEQEIEIASLTPTLEWDTRDDPLAPTRGLFALLSTEYAFPAFQAETHFLKVQAGASVYGRLPGGTGAAGLRLGAIHPFDTSPGEPENLQVPINVRFFAGGSSTHRAFRTDYLGLEGQTLTDGEPVGGNAMVLLNLEYLRPLSSFLTGVLFVDGGNVWAAPDQVRAGDLRWGVGAGLRLDTPAGPFRLEYGHKLDRKEGESSGEVYLSFGIPF